MTVTSPVSDPEDAAWVRVASSLSPEALLAFVHGGVERLLRLNPQMEFSHLERVAVAPVTWDIAGRNLGNGREVAVVAVVEQRCDGLSLAYADGLKVSTLFRVESRADGGADLVIVEDYSRGSAADRAARLDEVDSTLTAWGAALYRHLRSRRRWAAFRLWRWWMDRVWLPMTPKARRLTKMITLATAAEFVFFLMVFTIFWIETQVG